MCFITKTADWLKTVKHIRDYFMDTKEAVKLTLDGLDAINLSSIWTRKRSSSSESPSTRLVRAKSTSRQCSLSSITMGKSSVINDRRFGFGTRSGSSNESQKSDKSLYFI